MKIANLTWQGTLVRLAHWYGGTVVWWYGVRWASLGVYSCLLLTWYGTVVRWYGTMVRYGGTVGIPCHAIYSCLLLSTPNLVQ